MSDTDIAVVGMAAHLPGARDAEAFWRNVRDGVESVETYSDEELRESGVSEALLDNPSYVRSGAPIEDMALFDAEFFGFSPKDAAIMDPQHRHLLECAWATLENAGHMPERFDGLGRKFAIVDQQAIPKLNRLPGLNRELLLLEGKESEIRNVGVEPHRGWMMFVAGRVKHCQADRFASLA